MRFGIALGSNLGDRLENLRIARDRLQSLHLPEKGPFRYAPVFESAPVGCPPGSSDFLNTVVELESNLDPLEFLDRAQEIERDLGRPEHRDRNSPRSIDVDILYAGELELDTARLTIPHPAMTGRGFVLLPLSRIRPNLVIPGQKENLSALLEKLGDRAAGLALVREDW